jgi:hypothetical protein
MSTTIVGLVTVTRSAPTIRITSPAVPLKSIDCDFDGVECSSEAEWQAKVQPYVPGWRS